VGSDFSYPGGNQDLLPVWVTRGSYQFVIKNKKHDMISTLTTFQIKLRKHLPAEPKDKYENVIRI